MKTRLIILACVIALLSPVVARGVPVADVAVFHLNEGTGTAVADATGNGYDGTLVGPPGWTNDSQFGKALDFDGSSDYVQTPLTQALSLPLSVEAWVKTDQTTNAGIVNKYIAGSLNGFQVFMHNSYLHAWYFASVSPDCWTRTDSIYNPALLINDGEWHHSVTVFDNTGTTQYVDGALACHSGWTGTPGTSTETTPLRLGTYPASGNVLSGPFDGLIDEVAIYNKALTLGDAQARYANGPPQPPAPPPANPVCLNLDEGQGTTTREEYSGQDATLYSQGSPSNAPWTAGGKFGAGLDLDASKQQYVETAYTQAMPLGFSVEGWFKTDQDTGYGMLVNKYVGSSFNGFMTFLRDGELNAWYYASNTPPYDHTSVYNTGDPALQVADGEWHHHVVTFDASGTNIYIDGQWRKSGGWVGTAQNSSETTPLRLGMYPAAPSVYFDGCIDAVALYGWVLTPDEVAARYGGGPPHIPEPATLCLLGLGLGVLARRRRR